MGSNSSNWSAPIVEMLGLVPPVPTAMIYRARKKIPFCNGDALGQLWSAMPCAHCGGLKDGSETDRVNKHIPCGQRNHELSIYT